jgi:hypothetical protein
VISGSPTFSPTTDEATLVKITQVSIFFAGCSIRFVNRTLNLHFFYLCFLVADPQLYSGVNYTEYLAKKSTFIEGFKVTLVDALRSLSISTSQINVTNVSPSYERRVLLSTGVTISYTVSTSAYNYSTLSSSILSATTTTNFTEMLTSQTGFTGITVSSTQLVNLSPTQSPTRLPTLSPTRESRMLTRGGIAGIVIGCFVGGVIIVAASLFFFMKRSRASSDFSKQGDQYEGVNAQVFTSVRV